MKSFKHHLVEFDNPQIYCDMDGVVADFHTFTFQWVGKKFSDKYYPEIIVHLRPTSPHRPSGIIDKCVKMLAQSDSESLRCVTECVGAVTPYKMWNIDEQSKLKPILNLPGLKEPFNAPRQSLPKTYLQTGTVDVVKVKTILDKSSMTGDNIMSYVVDSEYALDIDDHNDLKIMRSKFKAINYEQSERRIKKRNR